MNVRDIVFRLEDSLSIPRQPWFISGKIDSLRLGDPTMWGRRVAPASKTFFPFVLACDKYMRKDEKDVLLKTDVYIRNVVVTCEPASLGSVGGFEPITLLNARKFAKMQAFVYPSALSLGSKLPEDWARGKRGLVVLIDEENSLCRVSGFNTKLFTEFF